MNTPPSAQRNSAPSPVDGISMSMKRDRPDGEGDGGSPSPAHKRRDTGEGKTSQNLMMPPPPPPSAASSTGASDPSQQQQQQSSNSGLGMGRSVTGAQAGGLSSMGTGLFPSGQNAQSNALGDLSATGLFAPGPSSTPSGPQAIASPGGLDAQARQMHMRMQMGRMSQQQQQQASQFLAQGMGVSPQQQQHMLSQMQGQNAQAQQAMMMSQGARQQEISLGSSVSQRSPPPLGGPGGMQQHQQGAPHPQSPSPGQANPPMGMQLTGGSNAAPGQQSNDFVHSACTGSGNPATDSTTWTGGYSRPSSIADTQSSYGEAAAISFATVSAVPDT